MRPLHLPELSYPARIRRNKFVIWAVIVIFLWVGIQIASDPDKFFAGVVQLLNHILPD